MQDNAEARPTVVVATRGDVGAAQPSDATNDVEAEDPDRLENMYWDGFLAA